MARARTSYTGTSDAALRKLTGVFQTWMHMPDLGPLYALLGTMIAHRQPSPPVWLMLTGAPSCQPAGSTVLMADGSWRAVEGIVTGDVVVSPQKDGSSLASTVLATFKLHNEKLYRVCLWSHGKIVKSYFCSGSHILPLARCPMKWVKGLGRKAAQPVEVFEIEAEKFTKRGRQFKSRCKAFTTTAVQFPERVYPVPPYLLGVMLGDGCWVGSHMNICNPDKEIFDRLERMGVRFGKTSLKFNRKLGRMSKAVARTILNPMRSAVKQLSCYGTRSVTKFVPRDYMAGSIEQRLELLAGLIDTDGSVNSYSSSSEQLADDFIDLVHSVGGFATKHERTTRCNGKEFPSFRVQYSFGDHKPPLSVVHKRLAVRNRKLCVRNKAVTVEEAGQGTVFGFRLDSPSNWFVTDDWVITHNCGKSELIMSLGGLPHLVESSRLTVASLISGTARKERAKDATGGVMRKIGEAGVLALKDFSSVLALPREQLVDLLGALREIYDGKWVRDLGSDGARTEEWRGKMSLVTGCPPVIDQHHGVIASMGERFVLLRYPETDGAHEAAKAAENDNMEEMREALRAAMAEFLTRPFPEATMTPAHQMRIVSMASLAAKCRSAIPRHSYTREVEDTPSAEYPSRLAKVLVALWCGMRSAGVGESRAWQITGRVAFDSMPRVRSLTFGWLISQNGNGEDNQVARVADHIRCSRSTARRVMEDLALHGVLEAAKGVYRVTPWAMEKWREAYF